MVKRCYPKVTYYAIFSISISCLILAVFIFFFETGKEKLWYESLWFYTLVILSIVLFKCGLLYYQSYFMLGDNLIVCDDKEEMTKIDLKNAVYEVVELKTPFFWGPRSRQKWICVYDKNWVIKRFNRGCSNKKKTYRIQVIFSEEFISELEKREVKKIVE